MIGFPASPKPPHIPRVASVIVLATLSFLHLPSLVQSGRAEETSAFSRAVAAYNDRQLDKALALAKEAVRQEPDHADAYVLLGQLYYLRQELPKARESWQRALLLAPSRQDVRENLERLQKESEAEQSLSRSDTYPFVVRFAQGETPVDVGSLRQMLQETYRMVGQQFGYFPDHTITVLLYPQAGFDRVKGLSHQVAGLYDGKIRLPLKEVPTGVPLAAVSDEMKRILWHEYTHALVHDFSKGRCPTWFNEGIATLEEARVVPRDLRAVKAAYAQGRLLSWDSLWQQEYSPASLELCYSESYGIAQYLVKRWGVRGIVGVLKRLGQGYPLGDAMRFEYKTDPATLEKEWRAWLGRTL